MAWSIVASGIIVAVAAFRLRYDTSTDSFEEANKNVARGLGIALGTTGFYLFLTGITISFMAQFAQTYNILFGGVATLAGLVIMSLAAVFYLGHGLQAVSYFGFVVGLYLAIDAVAIFSTRNSTTAKLTSDPLEATLLYLASAGVLLWTPFAAHIKSKYARWVFGILAFLFAMAWLYFAYNTTLTHLGAFPST
jgi:uncharacterized membrane protein